MDGCPRLSQSFPLSPEMGLGPRTGQSLLVTCPEAETQLLLATCVDSPKSWSRAVGAKDAGAQRARLWS